MVVSTRSELFDQNGVNLSLMSRMKINIDFTEFLATCGGLLGLFIGFSFFSLVELIYFFSINVYCKMKKNGSRVDVTKIISSDTWSQKVLNFFYEYAEKTTLNGIKYIGDQKRHLIER